MSFDPRPGAKDAHLQAGRVHRMAWSERKGKETEQITP